MWLTLLENEVNKSSKQAVADQLGISRTTVSLVMNDAYPASTDKIEEKVLNVFGRVECPHTGESITINQCKATRTSSAPTSSPRAMRQWRACQSCPNNQGAKND